MPVLIDAANLTDDALMKYDLMMIEAGVKVRVLSKLADNIWSEVLRELDLRGKVKLLSGSYDDVGNAAIQRIGYPSE